ncbi:MAG: class I SAM-dependent DNA methyltransferase [Cyanobacteria bacterium P01_A01_bin.116]
MTPAELKQLEANLWQSADTLRANSDLKSSEYATPVLGLIFLKFADNKYRQYESEILAEYQKLKGGRREQKVSDIALKKCGFYLPDHARYDHLLTLPEEENIAAAIKAAMATIEEYKPELVGVLPQDEYFRLVRGDDKSIPKRLLKNFSDIPVDAGGDMFGQIYQYFLGNFALAEGQGGGEFFTPDSVVRLMVEMIEPTRGKLLDPACGSGGMFVQAGRFIQANAEALGLDPNDFFVYGQEKTLETVKLAKMNMAVNGLKGEVRQGNTYYEDPFESFGAFDYVLANPPFNVDDVNLSRVEADDRFNTYGVPKKKTKVKKADEGKETVPNANYLWINLFATALNATGRAGLVMANSASDARHSEATIRQTLIEQNLIDGMVTLPSNMFYTVTLPATLWFFDKGKADDRFLFIDARNVFTQVDRAHREFSAEQVSNLAVISHLRRGKRSRFIALVDSYFRQGWVRLQESWVQEKPVCEQLVAVLDDSEADAGVGKTAADAFSAVWDELVGLEKQYRKYEKTHAAETGALSEKDIKAWNKAQHKLSEAFEPFFVALHAGLKRLDEVVREHEGRLAELVNKGTKKGTKKGAKKGRVQVDRQVKALKEVLAELHGEVKEAEAFFVHVRWLQERFPEAVYEDVTGLCKLATLEDVAEQDYSLNPGRYVGVVIEEDGKTEEEFLEEILAMNEELEALNREAHVLEKVINHNIRLLTTDTA